MFWSVDFEYDGQSRRVKKAKSWGSDTFYLGDHFEIENGTEVKYIFAGNQRVAKVTAAGTHFFHKDHLGSSNVVTDYANGAAVETSEFLPFGQSREHTGTAISNYKYTDQELDPSTGLYNYDARLYDPVVGRFVSPDPYSSANLALLVGEIVSVDDEMLLEYIQEPKNLNRYAYVQNNPVNSIDPSGMRIELVGSDEQQQYTLSQLSKFTRGKLSIDQAGALSRTSSENDESIESDIDELISSKNLYRIHPNLPADSGFGRSHTVPRSEGGADIYFDPNVDATYSAGFLRRRHFTPAAELAHELLGRGTQIERGIPHGRKGSSTRRRSNLRAVDSANRAFIRMGMLPRHGYQ